MKSPAKRWTVIAGVTVAVLALVGGLLHWRARHHLSQLKERLTAEGTAFDPAKLQPLLVPAAGNGAAEFRNAQAMLRVEDHKMHPTPMSFVAPGRARCIWMESNAPAAEVADIWPGLRREVEANRDGLLKLQAALERPRLEFPVNYQGGFMTLGVAHLVPLKSAARRISAAVMMDLRDGNPDSAWLNLRALCAIPVRWHDEPLLISDLVRASIVSIAAATTWSALQHPDWSEARLAELQRLWEFTPTNAASGRALEMERAMMGDEYESLRRDSDRLRDSLASFGAPASNGLLDDLAEVGAKILESPRDGIQLFMNLAPRRWAWRPWNSYYDEAWAIETVALHLQASRAFDAGQPYATLDRALQEAVAERGSPPPQFLVSAISDGTFNKFLDKMVLMETQRRIVVTAIALRRHKLAHGAWPARLEEMVPRFLSAVPVDPMDARLLRYRSGTDDHPVLYSVGLDGVDASGDPKPLSGEGKDWFRGRDIVWPQRASAGELAEHLAELERKRPVGRR